MVPEAVLRVAMADDLDHIRPEIAKMVQTARQVLLIGSPPPKEEDVFIRQRLQAEPFLAEIARKSGVGWDALALSPPILRLKLWTTLQDLMRELAQECGALYVPCPKQSQTEKGFLHSCYAYNDVTHANQKYGELMIKELRQAAHMTPLLNGDALSQAVTGAGQ